MCEILVFLADNTHADPEIERAGCWKRGMPVVVMPDGHMWGREESKAQWIADGRDPSAWPQQGRFGILKLPTVSVERAKALIDDQRVDDAGAPYFVMVPDPARPGQEIAEARSFRRREWRCDVDVFPAPFRNALINDGVVSLNVGQVRAFLRRIRDNAQFTGLD